MTENKTKTSWLRPLAFAGILALILVLLSASSDAIAMKGGIFFPNRYRQVYGIMEEPRGSVDLVIMGDSLAYAAVSPMTLWQEAGITSYNCAQAGQNLQEAYRELFTVLPAQAPKVLLLETNIIFKSGNVRPTLNDRVEGIMNYRVPLFRGHDAWKVYLTKAEREEAAEMEGAVYKGYTLHLATDAYEGGNYMFETEDAEEIPSARIAYLDAIRKECSRNGTELILFSAPSPVNYSMERHNAIEACAAARGIPYLDMNLRADEIGIDWIADSLDDGDHVNLKGSIKTTQYLGRFLGAEHPLPDHRADASYGAWQEESETYEADVQRGLKKMGR